MSVAIKVGDVELADRNESKKKKEEEKNGNGEEDGDGSNKVGEPVIVVSHVHKTYLLGVEGVPALRGVSLSVLRGEFIMVLGKSGGGKTSFLNILGTIDKPTKGEVSICGRRITNRTPDAEFASLRLSKLGFVFQAINLISSMTAQENVELPMILAGHLSRSQRSARAKHLLSKVGLGGRLDHLPSQMSGGEQQRATIARAIANEPEILLLDEPTGDLDSVNSDIVMSMLLELNRKNGITLCMVTHDPNLVPFAHRVVHMLDGKIHRIECIPEETRRQADDDLRKQMERVAHVQRVEEIEVREPSQFYSFLRGNSSNTTTTKA